MHWSTDRRAFLKLSGAAISAAATAPRFAWAAEASTLRLRVTSDFQVLDPFGIIGELDDIIPRMTQVTLVRISDMREGNRLSNHAAEVFEWRDPQTIAFTLREGLIWTGDFGPVTTADVKFSFERIKGSESAWSYQFEQMREVEIIDDRQGLIHLEAPFAPFPVIALPYYGGHIVCQKAVEAAGGRYTTEIPAQCGPYLFDAWEQGQKVTLKKNPAWTGEPQNWETIEIYIVTDDQAAQLAFEADSFDYTRVAVAAATGLREALPEGAALIEAQSTRYVWLTINMNAEPLKDPRVRQAIQYAYDGESVLIGAYDGLVPRSTGVVPPGPYSRASNLIATRDVEKAKTLLAEAGAGGLSGTRSACPLAGRGSKRLRNDVNHEPGSSSGWQRPSQRERGSCPSESSSERSPARRRGRRGAWRCRASSGITNTAASSTGGRSATSTTRTTSRPSATPSRSSSAGRAAA